MPLLAAALLLAAPLNEDLARAQKALEELKYADAAKALDAAWNAPGSDLPTVLEILKLQAIVAASTGQQDRARVLFRTLLYLAPQLELPEGDLGPKVMSLFYEAKGRVSVNGVLKLEADAQPVTARVTDPQQLGKSVRFHHRVPGFEWAVAVAPVTDGVASVAVEAAVVEWWAELLGEKDRVLAGLGSADQPLSTAAKAPALVPRAEAVSPAVPPPSGTNLKPVAYVAAGAGIAAAIVGVVFGVTANGQKALIENAARDGSGRVTGITRQTALQLNAQQQTSATLANTLFVTSGVLIAAGVVLYVVSPDVKVSAGAGGLVLGGSL